jgi:hypothetical protein
MDEKKKKGGEGDVGSEGDEKGGEGEGKKGGGREFFPNFFQFFLIFFTGVSDPDPGDIEESDKNVEVRKLFMNR